MMFQVTWFVSLIRKDSFMSRNAFVVLAEALLIAAAMNTAVMAETKVAVWDGGNGSWGDANWNGGQDALTTFDDNYGMSNGSYDVTIGDTSQVDFDSGPLGSLRPRFNEGPTAVTVTGGAQLHHITPTTGDSDGNWTTWDADLNLDGGTFKRSFVPGGQALGGGILMLGSWRSLQNQAINMSLTNGGSLVNDGQVWFGADEEHALGLKVSVTINDGSWDLTGGDNVATANDGNDVYADFAIFYGTDQGDGDGNTFSGLPKDEEYEVKFTGPGSITVDTGGIVVYRQDEFGIWDQPWEGSTATRSSYEDLWDAGILKAHGRSGATAATFGDFFTTTGSVGAANYTLTSNVVPVKQVVWDGGNGSWGDANWNGGQDASTTFDGNLGMSNGGYNVTIGGGAQVDFDSGPLGSMRPRGDKAPTTVTIKEGAQLHHITPTTGDSDGNWTTWDADLNLDGGTFKRSFVPGGQALGGGILMLGSWRSTKDQEINMTVTNGGSLVNDGQVWFGADEEHALGLKVSVTINNGSWDLTGGDNVATANDGNDVYADLAIFYGTDQGDGDGNTFSGLPKDEEYEINFTGPGSITVDTGGIVVYRQDEFGIWDQPWEGSTATRSSYEDLWNAGILKANGLSGLTGSAFGDFFSTTGSVGAANYMLTSNILLGDFDDDGDVDGADLLEWQRGFGSTYDSDDLADWKSGFGTSITPAAVAAASVPEPASLALIVLGTLTLVTRRRRG
jgi:PEP-CTERM motif-containing protein